MIIHFQWPIWNAIQCNPTLKFNNYRRNLYFPSSFLDHKRLMASLNIPEKIYTTKVHFLLLQSQNHSPFKPSGDLVMTLGSSLRSIKHPSIPVWVSLLQEQGSLLNQIFHVCSFFPFTWHHIWLRGVGAVLSHCHVSSCRWQYGFLLIY